MQMVLYSTNTSTTFFFWWSYVCEIHQDVDIEGSVITFQLHDSIVSIYNLFPIDKQNCFAIINNAVLNVFIPAFIHESFQRLHLKVRFLGLPWWCQGRIRLPTQGTRLRALVQGDPTCHRPTKPVRHNYWAWALEPTSHSYWARVPQLLKPAHLEPTLCNKRSHHNEKPAHHHKE